MGETLFRYEEDLRGGHTYVTTVSRVRIKTMIMRIGHNPFNILYQTMRGKVASDIAIR
ncbi:MAG: hypothetical protein AAE975_00930 [Thermoplasmatales archaeon]|jgi:hypothetical protein